MEDDDVDLGYKTPWGTIEPFPSSFLTTCLYCGVEITEENDSGWEAFQEDGVTGQKLCRTCHEVDRGAVRKKER